MTPNGHEFFAYDVSIFGIVMVWIIIAFIYWRLK